VFDPLIALVEEWIHRFTLLWPDQSFFTFEWNVKGLLAVVFVCLVCGAMGSLVVGNRMAFFSDALAHCAFAGIALGILVALALRTNQALIHEQITQIMVVFGIAIGLMIAFVRERTELASDTVIGVFYAAAIGVGAVFMRLASRNQMVNIETFIFGDPVVARTGEVLCLGLLAAGMGLFLWRMFNSLLLTSASPSLARSRRVPVRLCQYLLIVLLGLTVNLSAQIVGALLINGMLIVPAATAANFARNLRQMFWFSIGLALASGVGGYVLSWEIGCHFAPVGTTGTIVVVGVLFFVVSMLVGRRVRDRVRPTAAPAEQIG
jgi:zinc transport system permease protein